MNPFIDLRSDTVSQPTPAMREAMAVAEVGDDVYGEDPTINRLEEMSAHLMGKESGLFVPSGTMGNLAAVLTHCRRGDEVIMGHKGHTFLFEAGGISALGGVFCHTIPNQDDGTLALNQIRAAIRGEDIHDPITRLVILENTHNRCGGVVLSADYTQAVGDLVHAQGLSLHLDGARLFNAAAALGVSALKLAEPADSVTFCLSKALCAPAGSVLCGTKEYITRARRIRKQLGGGMRQAGILAAAGIVAIEQMVPRLFEDHIRARRLAQGLSEIQGISLPLGQPQSNMVYCSVDESISASSSEIVWMMKEQGVLIGEVAERTYRMVIHYWIDESAIERTLDAFKILVANG